jgi:hypothetical protein
MDEDARGVLLVPSCRVYLHIPSDRNGKDAYWVGRKPGQITADVERACNLGLEQNRLDFASEITADTCKLWSPDYIDTIRWRLAWRQSFFWGCVKQLRLNNYCPIHISAHMLQPIANNFI